MKKKQWIAVLLALGMLAGCAKKEVQPSSSETPADSEEEKEVQETEEERRQKAAEALTASLSLEEQIGQLLMPALRIWSKDADLDPATVENTASANGVTVLNDAQRRMLAQLQPGGVILFSENIDTPEQVLALTEDLQACTKLPLLIAADQEGGNVARLSCGTVFAGNMNLAANGDPAKTEEAYRIMGEELLAAGIQVDFAPVVDVNTNAANPVIGIRSFSDDPKLCASFGQAAIRGLQEAGVISAVKHFPGHGDTDTDSHTGLPRVEKNMATLRGNELVPFVQSIEAGADLVMSAHIQYPAIETECYISVLDGRKITLPATLSKRILTGLLREEMHFEGVICTDSLQMEAIASHFAQKDTARLALEAGADLLLMPVNPYNERGIAELLTYAEGIADMVQDGEISRERIAESCTRILKLKMKYGLLQEDGSRGNAKRPDLSVIGSKEHQEAAAESAASGLTLLKNEGVLPITEGHTAVLCANRWVKETVERSGTSWDVFVYGGAAIRDFEAVMDTCDTLVILSRMDDLQSLSSENAELIDAFIAGMHERGKKAVVVSTRLPYDAARFEEADALVCTYSYTMYSQAIEQMILCLAKEHTYKGKLPVCIYAWEDGRFIEQVLFERGYGLNK